MKTTILSRALLAFSVVAGGFVIATPAQATVLRNYQDENFCMGVYGGSTANSTPIVLWQCDGSNNQNWGTSSFSGNQFYRLYDPDAPSPDVN
jgi:hypothetical protein